MNLELKYCTMWNYQPKAVSLASRVLESFKTKIGGMTLVPSTGGCFELSANGELLYSKLQTGQFPEEQAIIDMLGKRLAKK